MSYSAKVQQVFAPRGQGAAISGRFILLAPLPLEVCWAGKHFRFQVEQDPVSKELRLFARDMDLERLGQYSAYLLATANKRPELDVRIYTDGLLSEARPSYGMFSQLVKDGRARVV